MTTVSSGGKTESDAGGGSAISSSDDVNRRGKGDEGDKWDESEEKGGKRQGPASKPSTAGAHI